MKRIHIRLGIGAAAVAAVAVLGLSTAGTATAAPGHPDGTLVQAEGSPRVTMIVDGAGVEFPDADAVAAAGCAGEAPVTVSAAEYDAIPDEPDPLYAATDDEVDVDRITPDPTFRADCHPVYRADGRSPEIVFEQGFAAKDVATGQYDVRSYVLRNQPSPFVSTTYRDDLYKDWKPRFYYFLDVPGGIDVNATIGDDHKYAAQQEIAFPGGIMSRFIEKGCPVDRATLTLVTEACVDNPNYLPWRG